MLVRNVRLNTLVRFFTSNSSARVRIKEVLLGKQSQNKVSVQGWTRSIRKQKANVFIDINDGSTLKSLQLVLKPELFDSGIQFGSSVVASGIVSDGKINRQQCELICDEIKVIGTCDPQKYPFKARVNHDMEYLRSMPHLRMRQPKMASVLRARNQLEMGIHKYFQERGFLHVHTPLITSSDCEGAGQVFTVQPNPGAPADETDTTDSTDTSVRTDAGDNTDASVRTDWGDKADHSGRSHFFGTSAFLTVSGQLHLEACAMGLGDVYTLSPAFRAERSNSRRHLNEFRMLEVELAHCQSIDDLINLIESSIQSFMRSLLDQQSDDLALLFKDKDYLMRELEDVASKPYVRMSYSDAIELIRANPSGLKRPAPSWGDDINSEQEELLTRLCDSTPVFVVDFPAESKPFYMKRNPDGKTVSAVDLIFSRVGEVCGGSLREDDIRTLEDRLASGGMLPSHDWYLDLRRYGNTPHAGFGMGFDRLVAHALGVANIRDVAPFPRTPGSCPM